MKFEESVNLLKRKGYQVVVTVNGAKICYGGSSGWDSYSKRDLIRLANAKNRIREVKVYNKRARRINKIELKLDKEVVKDRKIVKGGDPWQWD